MTGRLWTAFGSAALSGASLDNLAWAQGPFPGLVLQDPDRTGRLLSPPIGPGAFDRAVVSWNGRTPPERALELALRTRIDGAWTRFHPLAVWCSDPGGPRYSCPGEVDGNGRIETDILRLTRPAEALQIQVLFPPSTGESPTLNGLAAALWDSGDSRAPAPSRRGRSLELDVPPRSQRAFPEGARSWCSPTCLAMLLEYWSGRLGRLLADPIPVAARATWDSAYGGAGNWSFNMAYASTKGLKAFVARLPGLAEAEPFLQRGVPLALSIAWGEGELPGAHLPVSGGHLVVLRGFDEAGDPILNDPAAPEEPSVRTVYPREPFEAAWIGHSDGICYIVEP